MHLDSTQKVGTGIGAVMGFVQTAAENLLPKAGETGITGADMLETVVLAGLGATVGFFVTNGWKALKAWWKQR